MIELAIYIVLTILLYPVTVFPYTLILLLFQNIPPIYKKTWGSILYRSRKGIGNLK